MYTHAALLLVLTSIWLLPGSDSGLAPGQDRSFVVDPDSNCFRKDGKCFQYISGSMHYYRIPKLYWKDRLQKLKAAGFNTIQTYIPWNYHEPTKGTVDFSGDKDMFTFLKHCADIDILVLLRPGPFIAAEYEFGGFPSWLLTESKTISFRTSESVYLQNVFTWFKKLLPALIPYLYHNGGPVIGVQVENEYGSNPACDSAYLLSLTQLSRQLLGDEILLFSVDGPSNHMLTCGTNSELYNTVDFGAGGNISAHFELQAQFNAGGPAVNTEYYPGWLSHWGSHFPSRSRTKIAASLDAMLGYGASVNMYMFHGGTNFGFTSGAKGDKKAAVFVPHTTSYDYDAPLNEAGDTTLKYWDIREVLKKYSKVYDVPRNSTKISYGKISMVYLTDLFDEVYIAKCGTKAYNKYPLSMEENNQTNGVAVYTKQLETAGNLTLAKVRDRAYILLDGDYLATVKGSAANTSIGVKKGRLDILVVSDGHINTGHVHMLDPRNYMKGITEPVLFDSQPLLGWNVTLLPLHLECLTKPTHPSPRNRGNTAFKPGSLYTGTIEKDCSMHADTFLDTTGWGKGVAYFQGSNLGRYWPLAGPQLTLYAPGPLCDKPWTNSTIRVTMLEFEKPSSYVTLTDTSQLQGPIDPSQL